MLYTRYVYFFQAAGLILLVAMIGAIVLTLQHKPNVRRQNIADQEVRLLAPRSRSSRSSRGRGCHDDRARTLSRGRGDPVHGRVFGIFVNRKNVIVILMSIELILLAVNINLVAFSAFWVTSPARSTR